MSCKHRESNMTFDDNTIFTLHVSQNGEHGKINTFKIYRYCKIVTKNPPIFILKLKCCK